MSLYLADPDCRLYHGDVLDVIGELADGSVDCCVTSPPYWGLRDYGTGEWEGGDAECDHLQKVGGTGASTLGAASGGNDMSDAARERSTTRSYVPYAGECGKCGARRLDQQLGLEPTPEQYVERMVEVFREVRRVLADYGTLWLNLGDSYNSNPAGKSPGGFQGEQMRADDAYDEAAVRHVAGTRDPGLGKRKVQSLKVKDLVGVPWMAAFALRADGWHLRSDIIWSKPAPMPESVLDRPTKSHEYVFLLTKRPRYYYDLEAIREPVKESNRGNAAVVERQGGTDFDESGKPKGAIREYAEIKGANARTVWEIPTQSYPEAHFATFPEELPRRAIAAGCPEHVCTVCGKPRERIVERRSVSRTELPPTAREWRPRRYDEGKSGDPQAPGPGQRFTEAKTIGWTECGHDSYRPGIVLDPFVGSGTTCFVARKLARHSIGVDLNASYLDLAAKRLQQQSLFA